jgi:hypothetical protein
VVVEPHREAYPPLIFIIKIKAVENLSGLHGFFVFNLKRP